MRGACTMQTSSTSASTGTTVNTYEETTTRTQGLSSCTRGSLAVPGRRLRRTGRMRENMSGTPVRSEMM